MTDGEQMPVEVVVGARLALTYPGRRAVRDTEVFRVTVVEPVDDISFNVVDETHEWSVYWSEVEDGIVEVSLQSEP